MTRLLAMILCCVLLAAVAAPRPAQAIYMTGKELAESCAGESPRDMYFCFGYIAGVIDYHVLMQSLGTAPTVQFCIPESVTVHEAALVVFRYLKDRPVNNEFIATPAVAMALAASYPCRAAKKK